MSEDFRPGFLVLKIWPIFFSRNVMADALESYGRQGLLHDDKSLKRV